MSEISLNEESFSLDAASRHGGEVCAAPSRNARPRIVRLESGINAVIEVVGLADVKAVPEATLEPYKHVETRN